jgi:L,D-peptidoglycan transpeptidase YkuD (ErfK/YbiS/YcfS/YnhG family)
MFVHLPPEPSTQVVVVTSRRWASQMAVLRRFESRDGRWVQRGPDIPAWVGRNGFAPAQRRLQNTGQTPAGLFTIPQAFGAGPRAGVSLPYHRITGQSYWPYDPRDPRTYNVLQTTRAPGARWRADGQWSERLVDYGRQYRYAAVLGYNLPSGVFQVANGEWRTARPARTAKGGGIFLHVSRNRPTAGCVAIPLRPMRATLRWLRPEANPVIVMGPPTVTRAWRATVRAPR